MDCEYTDSNDILIDTIIDGVRHAKVQERLLDKDKLLHLMKPLVSVGSTNSPSNSLK